MTVTATGDTLYDLRIKLGFNRTTPLIGIQIYHTETGRNKIAVRDDEETRTFLREVHAVRHIRRLLTRELKKLETRSPSRKAKPRRVKRRR